MTGCINAHARPMLCVSLLLLTSTGVRAQPFDPERPSLNPPAVARSFAQLRHLVEAGDPVDVVDASGRRISGRLAGMSSTTLSVRADPRWLSLGQPDVVTLEQRDVLTINRGRPTDSLKNGATVGFWVGGVAAALLTPLGRQIVRENQPDGLGLVLLAGVVGAPGALIGAGIGALIDARLPAPKLLYQAGPHAGVAVSPMVGPGRAGAVVSVGF